MNQRIFLRYFFYEGKTAALAVFFFSRVGVGKAGGICS
jgi:hypothetical protein